MSPLLTIDDVASLLRLKPSGVRALVYRGQIPFVRLSGRILRFVPEQIEQYLLTKAGAAKQQTMQATPVRRRLPKKNANTYVDSLVEAARREVTAKKGDQK